MPIRNTTHILKNSDIIARPLPSTLLKGEAIVNTADGIMFFSGVTTSTSGWTQSGPSTPTFWEVGSNLYDLKIRNQIVSYSGLTNLSGKFLSGTTSGFVLADISSIVGVDTFTTGFTYSNNVATIQRNQGQPDLSILINTMTGLTVNGVLSATTGNFGTSNVNTLNATAGTITTLGSTTINANQVNATGGTITTLNSTTINATNTNISGTETVNNLTITGTGLYNTAANGSNANEIVNYGVLTSYTQTNDVYVTGNTFTSATNNTNNTSSALLYHGTPLNGPYTLSGKDTYTTGGTYSNSTKLISLNKNDGTTYTVDLTAIDVNDTYVTGGTITTAPSTSNINGTIGLLYNQDVAPGTYTLPFTDIFTTGFTYNATNNTLSVVDNNGGTLNASINALSGISLTNLTAGRVVYVGTGGLLTDEAGFTYDDGTNTFSVPSDGTVNVGTGGLNVAGSAVIQGSLTVFGPSISAFTSELYVEDPNIVLNYNPTGNTTITSIGAGWTIQNGNGLTATTVNDVHFNINRLDSLTGLTAGNTPSVTEYTASTGFANRGWITELNDIVIRSTDVSTPNGVRVLAEFDILDGGQY